MTRSLVRWTPSRNLFTTRMGRLFDEAFNDFVSPLGSEDEPLRRGWMPAVDIRETDEALTFYVELPGLTKEDIEITLENNILNLRGERRFEREEEQDNYHRIERGYGGFNRSFTLPSNVDPTAVDAHFENGILTVALAKAEEAKPHKVLIK